MTVEGFSARTIEFTAGYFPRLPAIIYIPVDYSLDIPNSVSRLTIESA